MTNLKKLFAKRLRLFRHSKGISQEKLAKLTGLSTSFISGMERGIYAPSFETLERLAKTLDISVNELFDN